jgi:hemerythrin
MAILSWHDQYLIGHALLDEEHKLLFRLINEFHTHWSENRDRHMIAEILNRLMKAGEQHFLNEERVMAQEGFPKLVDHRVVHEDLIDGIFKLNQELADKNRLLNHDITKFLKYWLVDHIVQCDRELGEFLARKQRTSRRDLAITGDLPKNSAHEAPY